jgi:hypothetical protein
MFQSNQSYYGHCDCVVFQNCTNITVIIPPPIIVPPIPPSGSSCSYTCEDIRNLQIVLGNLTDMVLSQQNDIDMLIAALQRKNNTSQNASYCA